jgi:hypothetical protein
VGKERKQEKKKPPDAELRQTCLQTMSLRRSD